MSTSDVAGSAGSSGTAPGAGAMQPMPADAGADETAMQTAGAGRGGGLLRARRDPATLRSELTQLRSELDTLLSQADSMGEEALLQAHDRILSQFSSMRHAARGVASQASRQLKTGVDVTSGYVQDKPMQSVTVAAAVGLVLGMLMSRS